MISKTGTGIDEVLFAIATVEHKPVEFLPWQRTSGASARYKLGYCLSVPVFHPLVEYVQKDSERPLEQSDKVTFLSWREHHARIMMVRRSGSNSGLVTR